MTDNLGVWKADDCALVLIDYQKEMFEVIRSEPSADLVEMQVRLLAKTAKAFGLPIVLATVGVGAGFNGPTLPSILSELDGVEALDRYSMNAFEDAAFSDAVKATGRKRLIIGGLHTEICLAFASVQAFEGRVRRHVRHRRGRRTFRDCAPHGHRASGARGRGADDGARGDH
jgi:nicotinamidase-related amidase